MDANLYRQRRDALIRDCGPGVIVVRGEGAEGLSPGFLHLTGLEEPRGVLLLSADGIRIGTGRAHPGPDYQRGRLVNQLLFLPPGDPSAARWGEDSAATADGVRAEDLQVDAVLAEGSLGAILAQALRSSGTLYYVRGFEPSLAGDPDPDSAFVGRVAQRLFGVTIKDATPIAHEMRRLKNPQEIEAIERSVGIVAKAFDRVAGLIRPGVKEYELEAEITRVYRSHGAFHAFDPIVGSGGNACLLHYKTNTGTVGAGELLLIDTGASLDGYKADITRTLPVDGRFTDRQREIYETVLRSQLAAIEVCRSGKLLGDVHARAYEVIAEAGFGEFFIHGTAHHLGLETHDVGDVHRALAPGAVITVEPGIYIPEEAIGVRIEDDVLVTASAPRILGPPIPKTVEDVERMLGDRRS